ncbi:MAG: DNA repair protein RecO [Deltaproteobacteria bacterium CG11_big_fil_rev_8_21_14_0_20_47_16]|nr:MAG: DNA repair protein RecO [Deltaproteobacteria bacterium CG11_big_fil_rev_8_21_14_0_20_47_16]
MTQTQQAVIISSKTLRETDILVRFATPHGRLTAIANSARRSQKRFPSGFPLGSEVEILCLPAKSSHLSTLQDMRIVRSFLGMDIPHSLLGAMSYALELVDRTWPEHQASPEKFARLTQFLNDLPQGDPAPVLQRFCWDWLGLLGFQPMVSHCVHCEKQEEVDSGWRILAESGGVVCPDCQGSDRGGIPMTQNWQRDVIPVWIQYVLDIKLKSGEWWHLIWGPPA